MFGTKCALVAVAGAATTILCSIPVNAAPEDEFITLNSVVTALPDGLQATGVYQCDDGIGYLDVTAQMATNGSGTISLVSYPPGVTLQCTGRVETWSVVLRPSNGVPVLVPYTEGTGTAQLNRKYWKTDSGQVPLHL
ncbi:hypothetical protein DFR70_1011100 [Nocardia tenerifensis]|uniref:Uncharacterized protein n=1 Tax=Nocardia tenerifensis TaxID=228006 RepID=A0A318KC14_9NOCA|nr:hypothetical protein [Nocardia tenerifensis]PXX71666.1 hypothetical protein DFR70_1011100 [Nocardia tenerifensis]